MYLHVIRVSYDDEKETESSAHCIGLFRLRQYRSARWLTAVSRPSIRGYFGLPIDALGGLLVSYTAGYLVSSFGSGRMLARISVGALIERKHAAIARGLVQRGDLLRLHRH